MICNIRDRRKRPFRWQCVSANVEPTWHDNSCADADQAEPSPGEFEYDEQKNISVAEAVKWADALPFAVTLYLYEVEG